ncbi:hypothetical protein NUW54_g6970 [Trametes sanguinea]|uniref:Uncharacterized protein n=1 Tax=Trametes sanguinea TaxID=158606 RepID=A0ACC1PTU0_9APHY|nr:hypothetical protein NUW54_g6970 [Trametes sanguinea]
MDKKLFVHLQGGRKVSGTLRGYDLFLNLVIDDALEETNPAQKHPIGTVVSDTGALFCLNPLKASSLSCISPRLSAATASPQWRHWRRFGDETRGM